ncbi:MAG TPA: YfcE family phosphodiesterase [Cryomorphaceae bacterium]|nr:YfcE family phosphodiesterase [Owenweeksia sp.]MBF99702.1 YfcE family phosphodiesterase [Owenweeksia sp.]HAD98138.1 YfcE family phosphodiesterase [Cryomorphaceae bacterium]HBF19715.1 YfcE family phosphodiesterase [Cryomorphaceae bacterium]HCQ16962.1 YfcE family phosphodiesterase [Cryomorphaceae bacterium]
MIRISLLSDTHSHIDDQVLKLCGGSDEIWHAGDIGNLKVTEALSGVAPVRAVYGNIDDHHIRAHWPKHARFYAEQVDVWITHIGGYPGRYSFHVKPEIYTKPPKLFICGHSHILKVMNDKKLGLLHMNPGAIGKHGFHKVRTLLRFAIDGDRIKDLEVVELPR